MASSSRTGSSSESRGVKPPSTSAPATYLLERDVQRFVAEYTDLLQQVSKAEKNSKDLKEIAALNFRVAERLQGFLTTVRSMPRPTANTPGTVLLSLDEIRMLETEAQLRLLRSEAVQQADMLDLGSVLVSNLDQSKILQDINRELNKLSSGDNADNENDSQEERNPNSVDLDKSDGLYEIINSQQATPISQLIGYENEAKSLMNLTRQIRLVGNGLRDADNSDNKDNRPLSIILYGPPGTGKTTSAQSVARELNLTYMYVNAENIISMWAGGTQKNIVKVFRRARIAAARYGRKSLLLIDEIDGLIKNRQKSSSLPGEEYSRITTFLQMLTPPVGIDNSQIVCMFTTNNLENLDPAFVNRARQTVFFGYVVQPVDRGRLFNRLLSPYANITDDDWLRLGTHFPEFVPRDIVNLASLARSAVISRLEQRMAENPVRSSTPAVFDLEKNRDVLLSNTDVEALTQNMLPATPVSRYFAFGPPPKHLTDWLNANKSPLVPEQVRQAFQLQLATSTQ